MWQYNPTELYHYGVLGMKWGVRKKIKDTLSRIKAKRVGRDLDDSNYDKIQNGTKKTKSKMSNRELARIKAESMSTKELQDLNARNKAINEYVNTVAPKKKTFFSQFGENLRKDASSMASKFITDQVKKSLDKSFNKDENKNKKSTFDKDVRLLSDEQLKNAVLRAKNEQKYKEYQKELKGEKPLEKVSTISSNIGTKPSGSFTTTTISQKTSPFGMKDKGFSNRKEESRSESLSIAMKNIGSIKNAVSLADYYTGGSVSEFTSSVSIAAAKALTENYSGTYVYKYNG